MTERRKTKAEYEAEGRATKAARLASVSRHARPSGKAYSHHDMSLWCQEQWDLLAGIAGVNPPSPETQQMALEVVKTLEQLPERPDPWVEL